ncbi:transcription elongation factor GreAB [Geobacter sp. DSM 9736]|uniref:transcription elongation factor GreAB n=1 Tax=Geobacter sp. DSM 9736 TaxID=1277350 RepID=UPI000B50C1E5|nr:transcription elongation factor GreAB [Geobacter sp. DSM 9736]SNB45229.1 GreA/GreB family elongation factor [Geobacter sp. DSM 9736]
MTKAELLQAIIASLSADLSVHTAAALAAHEAATHEECIPDNKYDTTALEASYIAQGQANRAQEIRAALDSYRTLTLQEFDDENPIRLTALVDLEDEEGIVRRFFLGPQGGGMKIADGDGEIMIITPGSPLGRQLLGRVTGDEVIVGDAAASRSYTIVAVC